MAAPPITSIEERMAHLEGMMEQMNYRLGSIENGQVQIRQELAAMRGEFPAMRSELTNKIDSNFHWMMGIMLTTWVTLAALIIGLFLQK